MEIRQNFAIKTGSAGSDANLFNIWTFYGDSDKICICSESGGFVQKEC